MISLPELRTHIITPLSDEALQRYLSMAAADIDATYGANPPDDAFRDGQLIMYVKTLDAFDGLESISQPGYTANWKNCLREIAAMRIGNMISVPSS